MMNPNETRPSPSGKDGGKDVKYTNNEQLNKDLYSVRENFLKGELGDLKVVIKTVPTYMMLASHFDVRNRYRIDKDSPNALSTSVEISSDNIGRVGIISYVGIDEEGKPIAVVGEESVKLIKENSVIMQNPEPIFYPVSHPYVQKAKEKARDQGKSEEEVAGIKIQVKGRYVLKERMVKDKDTGETVNALVSEFEVDQENGDTYLYNEYVSDVDTVSKPSTYNVSREELENAPFDDRKISQGGESPWISRVRNKQSYAIKVEQTNNGEPITLYTLGNGNGTEIKILPGAYFVFDGVNSDGTFINPRSVAEKQFKDTYSDYGEFLLNK